MTHEEFKTFLEKCPEFKADVRKLLPEYFTIPERENVLGFTGFHSRIEEAEKMLQAYMSMPDALARYTKPDLGSVKLFPIIFEFIATLWRKYPLVFESNETIGEVAAAFAYTISRHKAGRPTADTPEIIQAAKELSRGRKRLSKRLKKSREKWDRLRSIAAPPGSRAAGELEVPKREEDRRHPGKERINKRITRSADRLHPRNRMKRKNGGQN